MSIMHAKEHKHAQWQHNVPPCDQIIGKHATGCSESIILKLIIADFFFLFCIDEFYQSTKIISSKQMSRMKYEGSNKHCCIILQTPDRHGAPIVCLVL